MKRKIIICVHYAIFYHENSIQFTSDAKTKQTLVNCSKLQADTKLEKNALQQALIDNNSCLVPYSTI